MSEPREGAAAGRGGGMQLQLSERQRAAVTTAVTILAAAVILVAVGCVLWLLARFISAFSQVFLPLAVAAIAALVLQPYYRLLERRLPPALALAVLFLSIVLPLAGFLWFFGALIVDQISELVSRLPDLAGRLVDEAQQRWPQIRDFLENNAWGRRISEAAQGQGDAVVGGLQLLGAKAWSAGRNLLEFVGALLAWAILPVYLAFFLMADPRRSLNEEHLPFLKPETRRDVIYLAREFVNIIVAFFRGQLLVAFFQGLLFAIGFSVVGLRYGLVLGMLLGFLNIIPYLGSIVGLAITLPLAFFQTGGGASTLVGVIVVFTLVQLIEGYLLTPKIMGDRTGLHPMAIIVSVFFWGAAFSGIVGMILAIPLTAFLVVFWRLAREKYIREIV